MQSNERSPVIAGRLEGLGGDELLALAGEAVRRAATQSADELDDPSLVGSVDEWHRLECAVHAAKLRRVAAVERRKAWRGQAYNGVNLWTARLGLSRGEARTLVDSAVALERMPGTAARLADGTLGAGHVADAARTIGQLSRLGSGDGASHGRDADRRLDQAAAALDELVATEANLRGGLSNADQDGAGGQDGETSQPAAVSRESLRRRFQEFQHERAPALLAEREQRLRARRSLRFARDRQDPDEMPLLIGKLAPVTYAKAKSVVYAIARQHAAGDTRSFDQRCHDAVDRIFDIVIASGQIPDAAGEQPRVLLTVSPETLHDALDAPPAMLDGYGPLSSETARQICCDAEVTVVAIGDGSTVLNVGRDSRKPNRAQRRGAFARDGACIGCGAPLAYCQIHHVVYWGKGGPTDIDNLVVVCWDCHARIHHYHWRVMRGAGGTFRLVPPDRGERPDERLAG